MHQRICEAITSRRRLTFEYRGFPRSVDPYVYGHTRSGTALLRGYQVDGGSESGDLPGWRLFEVDAMESVSVTSSRFSGDAPGYNPDDPVIVGVHCRV